MIPPQSPDDVPLAPWGPQEGPLKYIAEQALGQIQGARLSDHKAMLRLERAGYVVILKLMFAVIVSPFCVSQASTINRPCGLEV